MKRFMVVALVLILGVTAFGQTKPGIYERAKLIKTYTTYIATSDDTLSFSVNAFGLGDLLEAREYGIVAVATDSVAADVYIDGKRSDVKGITNVKTVLVTYADSLVPGTTVWTTTTPYAKLIPLKSTTVDRLAGCTEFTIGTVFRATLNGTTAGRTLKYYLYWVK